MSTNPQTKAEALAVVADTSREMEVRSPDDAYCAVMPLVEHDREKFWVIALDKARRVINVIEMFSGGNDRVIVDVHTIARRLLQCRATRAILVHNHPNGRMEPSEDDLTVTKAVRMALDTLNIDLVDHLIIGDGRFMSLKSRGLM